MGAVTINPGRFFKAEDVATEAALAKHHAKNSWNGLFVLGVPIPSDAAGRLTGLTTSS